jgi:hypothetical protein
VKKFTKSAFMSIDLSNALLRATSERHTDKLKLLESQPARIIHLVQERKQTGMIFTSVSVSETLEFYAGDVSVLFLDRIGRLKIHHESLCSQKVTFFEHYC